MLGSKIRERFDAGAWSGQVDVARAAVTMSMLAGAGLVWLSIAIVVGKL